eukprot:gene6096-6800_t
MEYDKMIIRDIFQAAKLGDLEKLRNLCEEQIIDFNIRDEWDSTPLYYACLCGHEDMVEFMLKNGARCKANTFDGERCLYAALTQQIKQTLKQYKAITAQCMRREYFHEFLRSSFQQPMFHDIIFDVHGKMIQAHKVIVTARCPYMAKMFQTKWKDRRVITIKHHRVDVTAFHYFIQYLYTGRVDMSLAFTDSFIVICKQCKMSGLISEVETALRNFHRYADSKPGYMKDRVSLLTIGQGTECSQLNWDFTSVAECCIPSAIAYKVQISSALPDIFGIELDEDDDKEDDCVFDLQNFPPYADMCINVGGHKLFCHQVFMCGRSEYFSALRNFSMSQEDKNTDMFEVTLNDISAEAFVSVLYYIYTDRCQLSSDNLLEVLYFSDMFLLAGLRQQCSVILAHDINCHNVVQVCKIARLYKLHRLEAQCCEFMADRLSEVICQSEFAELVRDDATGIQGRQETDSIPIIDDIRYHILKYALPGMDNYDHHGNDGKVYFAYETGNQTTVKGSESVGKKCEGFTLSKLDKNIMEKKNQDFCKHVKCGDPKKLLSSFTQVLFEPALSTQ